MIKHQHFSKQEMAVYKSYFYDAGNLPTDVCIDRFYNEVSATKCAEIAVEQLSKLGLLSRSVVIFEDNGFEADTRVARYYSGKQRSVFRNIISSRLEVLHVAHKSLDSDYFSGAVLRMSAIDAVSNADALFGISNSILLFEKEAQYDYAHIGDVLLDICIKHKNGHIRQLVPHLLSEVLKFQMRGVGSGFGSDDFGGFFFDAIYQEANSAQSN